MISLSDMIRAFFAPVKNASDVRELMTSVHGSLTKRETRILNKAVKWAWFKIKTAAVGGANKIELDTQDFDTTLNGTRLTYSRLAEHLNAHFTSLGFTCNEHIWSTQLIISWRAKDKQ